jgi:hypothetical protein
MRSKKGARLCRELVSIGRSGGIVSIEVLDVSERWPLPLLLELIGVLDASESLVCDRRESMRYDRAMKFQLSKHAQERIASRNIPASFVEQLLECPQQVLDEALNKQIYQSQFQFPNGRTYLLRAIVDSSTHPVIVASICKTNQIKRYWKAE